MARTQALQLIAALLHVGAQKPDWPSSDGIHDGDNKIVWTSGCCDGDLIVIDFRDEQGDGNQGKGLLVLANGTNGQAATYEIGPFWGMWKSFGPFCAPHGTHTLAFTSDDNPGETSVSIIDSFGLVRGRGGMSDFPISFNTSAPARFCFEKSAGCPCSWGVEGADEDEACAGDPCVSERSKERSRKIFAYHLQFKSRTQLAEEGWQDDAPYDTGFSVLPPPP